jgi:hypothetical protein
MAVALPLVVFAHLKLGSLTAETFEFSVGGLFVTLLGRMLFSLSQRMNNK